MRSTAKYGILFFTSILGLFIASCNEKSVGNTCKISVASSLSRVMDNFSDSLAKYEQINLEVNSGPSGTLAQQIFYGKEVDVFCSANEQWIETVNDSFEEDKPVSIIANNSIVLAYSKESTPLRLSNVLSKTRIAIANMDYVPLGSYTKSYFDVKNLQIPNTWVELQSAAAVFNAVELNQFDAGFTYESDALSSSKIDYKDVVPGVEVNYLAMDLSNSEVTNRVIAFFHSQKGKEIWQKHHFKTNFVAK